MTGIKSMYVNRLQLESGSRVAASTIRPRMSHLVSYMQAHPSHWVATVESIFDVKMPYGARNIFLYFNGSAGERLLEPLVQSLFLGVKITTVLNPIRSHNKLTPRRRVLLDKLIVAQLAKKFPFFYGARTFNTVSTETGHWTISNEYSGTPVREQRLDTYLSHGWPEERQ
jgi:hypothetical protein